MTDTLELPVNFGPKDLEAAAAKLRSEGKKLTSRAARLDEFANLLRDEGFLSSKENGK